LAIAENIEDRALYVGGEKRDTGAAKLMQRFAEHPFSTWKTIELSLSPYKTRLRAKRPAFLTAMENQLDEIVNLFQIDDFMEDRKLSGEFLLGYHCQRQTLRTRPEAEQDESGEITAIETN
jgi:CRISPR-associated protein Csd1